MGPAFSHISGPSGIYRDKLAGMFLFDMSCLWASYRPIWNISNLQQWPYYILQVPLTFLDLLNLVPYSSWKTNAILEIKKNSPPYLEYDSQLTY